MKELFKWAKMSVRQFINKDEVFNRMVSFEDRSRERETIKVHRILWNVKEDKITILLSIPSKSIDTKRKVLQFIATHYDPIGWITTIVSE